MILLYTKMLRIKQWLKNLLIFIPFVIEYQIISIELIKEGEWDYLLKRGVDQNPQIQNNPLNCQEIDKK